MGVPCGSRKMNPFDQHIFPKWVGSTTNEFLVHHFQKGQTTNPWGKANHLAVEVVSLLYVLGAHPTRLLGLPGAVYCLPILMVFDRFVLKQK